MAKADVKFIYSRWLALKEDRQEWMSKWEEVAKYFYPNGFRKEGILGEWKKAHAQKPDIFDSTPIEAIKTLASGMYGAITSPSRPWFTLRLQGFETEGNHEAKMYIDEVEERMRVILTGSNFYNVIRTAYMHLGGFGTACVYATFDMSGMHFEILPAGSYVFDVDKIGNVDTVIRSFPMSMRQLQMEFGEEALPETMRMSESIKKNPDTVRYTVYHAVMPRPDIIKNGKYQKQTINAQERPYASVYFMQNGDSANRSPHILRESGFDVFPYFGVRWDVNAGEVYGVSPAMDCLPDAKMIQNINKNLLSAVHLAIKPPLLASSELQGRGLNLIPGGITYINSSYKGSQAVTPLYNAHFDYNGAMSMLENHRAQINKAMHVDLFRMFVDEDRRQITAKEITSKEEEKLVLIGHVLERLQSELFNPLIDWLYYNMGKYNMLPEAPEILQGSTIKVEYTSALAQAQKIASVRSIEQFVAFAGNTAGINPEILDNVNFDKIAKRYSENLGVEAGLLRSDNEVKQIRQQRQQEQQAMQSQQAMASMADTANKLGNTPVGSEGQESALDAMIGGMGAM